MDKTTDLFCPIDDFCQQFEPLLEQQLLDESCDKRRRSRRTCEMSLSEMTTIVVLFDTMRGRHFKAFYRGTVCHLMNSAFARQLFPHPLRGIDAALRRSAGGLVRRTQGRLHGHFLCRLNAIGRLPQFAHLTPQRVQRHCPTR